jgi:hypothetical protein
MGAAIPAGKAAVQFEISRLSLRPYANGEQIAKLKNET